MPSLTSTMKRITGSLPRLRRDTRAVAMIEMGFALPALIFTSFAGLELANLMIVHTRVSAIALSVADNASRIAAGSTLSQPQVRETDVNDVFTGALAQSGALDVKTNGRIILSSLETNAQGGQWIHWQRCFGDRPYGSSFGTEGMGIIGTTFPGMGPAGREVKASPGAAVMFVEVEYDYQPFIFASWVGTQTLQYTAAFGVRDARDTTMIYNPAPVATPALCSSAPPRGRVKNTPNGNAWGWWGW